MEWTREQKQVIDLRNCNILVSAAAGSGKTAVLVQRILSRIMDKEHPVSVDEFVIVTFTEAAASQMKERLQKALEKALADDPDNGHLQRQIMLVPMAQISTIHKFCGSVIKNYFHRIGADPSYRVGNESELGLVRSDVMQQMLEEKYAEADGEFLQMAVMSRFVKGDAEIEDIVLSLYDIAVSDPFPANFLERMKAFVSMETEEELRQSAFMRENMEYVHHLLAGICEECRGMISVCDQPDGPIYYREAIADDLAQMESLCEVEEYGEMGRRLGLVAWKRLSGKKMPDADENKKKAVKRMRDAVKDAVKSLRSDLFDQPLGEQLEQLADMRGTIIAFVDLTLEFMERYRAKKSEKGVVDFDDLEQLALEILVQREEDGTIRRTEAAEELSQRFVEIMMDEYQDSNQVQEMLMSSVASERNRFMVGDIKQSIYRFRMACPELFLEKLNSYRAEGSVGMEGSIGVEDSIGTKGSVGAGEDAADRLVTLNQNFRSRDVVLEGTNAVFEKIMHPELGGVEYDEKAKLRLGADFPPVEQRTAENIDVYVLSRQDKAENRVSSAEEGSYEGKVIAGLIEEYTGTEHPLYVYDDGSYRRAKYGDIVILARSTKAIGQQIYDVLASEGIPVHMENTKGFFDTREISVMVNLFYIIDNPRQDIPLAAVLRSPMFDFTDEELAVIRGRDKKRDFYDSLLEAAGGQSQLPDELVQKIASFLDLLNRFRQKMTYVTVADMIQDIYDCTHIDHIFMAMKNGVQRKANLDMLWERAREFDQTSYRGLYQFVRYISGIKKREEDLGEANLLGDRDNVVRIMTIHKSKGLEFPVCIMAGMGRGMTGNDNGSFLMVNPSFGIASRVIDNDRGISVNNIFYRSLSRMNALEGLGEELRVLYVAMTRAKEKLVLVGFGEEEKVPSSTNYFQRIRAKSYFDWVLPAIRGNNLFAVHWVRFAQLEEREVRRQADIMIDEVMLNNFDTTIVYDEKIRAALAFMDEYQGSGKMERVPTEPTVLSELSIPTKLTVSEIKRRSMEEIYSGEPGDAVIRVPDAEEPPVPNFAKENGGQEKAAAGAGYGTIWHQVMASLDFSRISGKTDVEAELQRMIEAGRIRSEDAGYIRPGKIAAFLKSPLGQEVKAAKADGRLFREQPFVIGVRAGEVLPDTDRDDTVLVQGIMDAFYETEDGIVLLDYKTDHLEEGQEDVLAGRYRMQMEMYAKALEGILKKKVVRKVLYSFSLNEEITV